MSSLIRRIKVFYPEAQQISFRKVRHALLKYAPENVVFVDSPLDADVQFVDFYGQHVDNVARVEWSLHYPFPIKRRYVIVAHATGHGDVDYTRLFKNAVAVVSYTHPSLCNFYGRLDYDLSNWILTPWCVDNLEVSREYDKRDIDIVYSGLSCKSEYLDAIRDVCIKERLLCIHTMGKADCDIPHSIGYVDEETMYDLYRRSKYVNGMRIDCGFELGALEGAFFGARPIYLDLPVYRYYFGEIGTFVRDIRDPRRELSYILKHKPPPPPAQHLEQYKCNSVMTKLWDMLLEFL